MIAKSCGSIIYC